MELMHALGFEKAILIGNSAGGGIALDIALKYPQAVHGNDDKIIPQSDSRRLVSLNNHFAFVPLAGLGHVPQEEGPQAFLEVVLPWLRNTLGLPSST